MVEVEVAEETVVEETVAASGSVSGAASTEDVACVEALAPAILPMVVLSPTDAQKAQIRLAVNAATSLEEVQRLERALQEGEFDVIARAAARAAAQIAEAQAEARAAWLGGDVAVDFL